MGLKKQNHTIEELGLTLPTAYAYIRNLYINGEHGVADFAIQATRDKAIGLTPLKTVSIEFKVNRDENPYKTAYNFAKSVITEQRREKTIRHEMPFYGWTDDIL